MIYFLIGALFVTMFRGLLLSLAYKKKLHVEYYPITGLALGLNFESRKDYDEERNLWVKKDVVIIGCVFYFCIFNYRISYSERNDLQY